LLGIDRTQHFIVGDPGVEPLNEETKGLLAARELVDAAIQHVPILRNIRRPSPQRSGKAIPAPARISTVGRTIACAALRPVFSR